MQSIERAFELLQALAVEPAGLTELSLRVDLPKSTVARMLGTLEGIGAVARDDDDRTYRIGMGLVELAGAVDASAALATLVRPHLTDLADRTGEAAGFSVPTGYSMHYLVQVESPNAVQVRDYSGLTVPMHVGPSGLCVMSLWPDADVNRYLAAAARVLHAAHGERALDDQKAPRGDPRHRPLLDPRGIRRGDQLGGGPGLRSGPASPGSDPRSRPHLSISRDRRSRRHCPARDGCGRTGQCPRHSYTREPHDVHARPNQSEEERR